MTAGDGQTGDSVFEAISGSTRGPVSLRRLCQDSLDLVPSDGASLSLMSGDRAVAASASVGEIGVAAQDFELILGEGPGIDAHLGGQAVHVGEISGSTAQWPEYVRVAVQAGVHAVDAFPLKVGAARFGVLLLYRTSPGFLPEAANAMAYAVAEAVTLVIIDLQADAPVGGLAGALEDGADFRAVVHQATGVVAMQLGCGLDEALVRLRAMAYVADRSLSELAADVVAGRLDMEGA